VAGPGEVRVRVLASANRVHRCGDPPTLLLAGERTRIYSINLMRARHSAWFKEDLEARSRRSRAGVWCQALLP
jgi:hypothetical protein